MENEQVMTECARLLPGLCQRFFEDHDHDDLRGFSETGFSRLAMDVQNVGMAGRMAWEKKELGSDEAWLFAHRNGTPIVPPGHCGHPDELVKRGFIDGFGWPDKKPYYQDTLTKLGIHIIEPNPSYGGKHFYLKVNGVDAKNADGRLFKCNTYEEAKREGLRRVGNLK